MKTAHVEFPEALKELAQVAGIELKARGPSTPPAVREVHRAAMAEALSFFRENLGRSASAREYIEQRAIDGDTIEAWDLGYAPDSGEALANHLRRKGFDLGECKTLFLVDERDRGGFYDKFRGRLMFPIKDERGELVAFGGRLLGEGQPKYINSSDTPLYRKSRVLYGFDRARDRISRERKAVLVEGYLDVIACHRADETTAVASLGTALSEEHAKLLKRWVEDVTILYDADEAGQKAAERAVGLLRNEGLRVRVALMPPGEDPDTLLRKAGPVAVRKAVEGGLTPLQFAVGQLEARRKPTEEAFWTEFVAILANSPSDLEADVFVTRLSQEYPGTKDPTSARKRIMEMVQAQRGQRPVNEGRRQGELARPSQTQNVPLSEPMLGAEFHLFRAFQETEFRRFAWMFALQEAYFETGAAIALSRAIREAFPQAPPEGALASWLPRLPEEQQRVMESLRMDFRSEVLNEATLADAVEVLKRRTARRDMVRLRRRDLTAQERQEIHLRLKSLHPNAQQKYVSEDEDPFA
jgi:DNA primase